MVGPAARHPRERAVLEASEPGPQCVSIAAEEVRQEMRVGPIEEVRVVARFGDRLVNLDATEGPRERPGGDRSR